jgi:hypothetical protein
MKKYLYFLGILTLLLVSACQKKPVAAFEFNQENYSAGDSLILVNKSTLSNSYRWTLPFGGIVTSKDLRIKLDSNLTSGYYSFKLESFSKNRKLVDAVEQNIYVTNDVNNSSRGFDVMFWAVRPNNNNTNPVMVTLNYQSSYIVAFANNQNASEPTFTYDLSSNYAVFLNVQKGQYSYTATQPSTQGSNNGNIWTGVVNIDYNKKIIKLPIK